MSSRATTSDNWETDLARALGLSGENGSVAYKMVTQTKQKLGEWWFKLRHR